MEANGWLMIVSGLMRTYESGGILVDFKEEKEEVIMRLNVEAVPQRKAA